MAVFAKIFSTEAKGIGQPAGILETTQERKGSTVNTRQECPRMGTEKLKLETGLVNTNETRPAQKKTQQNRHERKANKKNSSFKP